ncbi:MAG TPA: NAD-dependent epimerase/dehydratase family protein [Polyangiales bacterium]|jgi:nucleoside-diphosphate-sugar epimerase|nr:NAD-dependent epimerase/dehydratase family protein [Polyangiales bacterium]
MSKVAIVTGASGFIGGRLRDALLDDGWDVVALTRKGSPAPKRGRGAGVDYEDLASLERVIAAEKPELVFHVAGATKGVRYHDFQRGNVMPTRNLALAVRKAAPNVGRFVHVSSLTVYGPSTHDEPRIETHERKPVEHYGKSKLEAELVLEREIRDTLPWTIVRPAGVYGPGDVDNYELFKLAAQRLNVFYGNHESKLSAVYVDDVVRAMRDAAASNATLSKGYFICDGEPLTWRRFQQEIVEVTGKRALTLSLPAVTVDIAAIFGEALTAIDKKPRLFNRQKALMGKQIAWTCRHDAAKRDFGYTPKFPLRDGVKLTREWYLASGWLKN